MKSRLIPALFACAAALLATGARATEAQAAAARSGVLLINASGPATRVLDVRTGQFRGEIGAGAYATVARRTTLAYTRDIDPCVPDEIEGCQAGAYDLLTSAVNGTRERVLVHNPEARGGVTEPDWSPDGTRLVYSWNTQGEQGLNLIDADGSGNEQIVTYGGPGTFSPDGRRVAFVKDGNLQVIDLATRQVRAVTTEGLAKKSAPDWSPDGRRLVYTGESTFYVVPAAGGVSVAAEYDALLQGFDTAVFSPDGRQVAFTATESFPDPEQPWVTRVFVSSPDGSRLTRVADSYQRLIQWLG